MADTAAVYDLVLVIISASFGQEISSGQRAGYRVVEIDYAAPDLGMFEGKRAAQSPQSGMSRVRPITF
jgi:hypothetical protein